LTLKLLNLALGSAFSPSRFLCWVTLVRRSVTSEGSFGSNLSSKVCIGLNGKFLRFRRDGPFLKRLVTCDETWIFYDNVIWKRQWCRPGKAPKPTPKKNLHSKKLNFLCLVGYGRDYYELPGPNKTINTEVYCQQLDRVNECLKERRPHLVNRKGVAFHQDSARPHVSKMTQ
jgi:hypothetical protein